MTSAGDRRINGDYRLIPIAGSCWLGVLTGQAKWGTLFLFLSVSFSVFLLVLVARRKFCFTVIGAWTAFVVGFAVGQLALWTHMFDPATQLSKDGALLRLQVSIREEPKVKESQWGQKQAWALADINAIWHEQAWVPSRARVVLTGDTITRLHRFDRVETSGTAKTGFRDSAPSIGVLKVRYVGAESSLTAWETYVTNLRGQLRESTRGLPADTVAFVPAMSIGDDSSLSDNTKEVMRSASLIHLTVVSGAHMAIAFAALAVLLPGYRYLREITCVLFALILVGVVGPQPSVIRAGATCFVASWGAAVGRRGRPQATLALVVLVCVLTDPWCAPSFGFALSVLATWGIIFTGRTLLGYFNAIVNWKTKRPGGIKIASGIANAAAVTISAQLWILPILVRLTGYIPTWGVFANILVAPVVAPMTILSLLAAFTAPLSHSVSRVLCLLATPFAQWIGTVARFCASLPLARIAWIPGPLGIVGAVLLVGLVVVRSEMRKRRMEVERDRGPKAQR